MVNMLSEELTLLRTIYSELREIKKKIDNLDRRLLSIKIMLLKEEEVSQEEKEEIEELLSEPEENYITLDEFKRKIKA